MSQRLSLNVNGKNHNVDVDPDMPLLYALRNDIGLNNPHFGCGLVQCGACTVHLDGQPIRSCITPVSAVGSSRIVTLAGLGTPDKPHPLQTAYVEEQVPQCGYCINGWIMTAAAFLRDKKKPTEAEIRTALVAATDPGHAVNPAQIERQIAGSFVYGLSALFYQECTVKDGRIEQTNFDTYNSMRISEMPKVESIIMPFGGFWGGVGEPTIFVAAPAVLNAIFAATGKRFRSFPLMHHNLRLV
jgi:nicotinate dehydrogenase subunit A